MTTHSQDSPFDIPKKQTQLGAGLTLSPQLRQAIENLSVLPEFRAIERQHGEPAMVMAITQLLRETRPELFNPTTPGDQLAQLFTDLESDQE